MKIRLQARLFNLKVRLLDEVDPENWKCANCGRFTWMLLRTKAGRELWHCYGCKLQFILTSTREVLKSGQNLPWETDASFPPKFCPHCKYRLYADGTCMQSGRPAEECLKTVLSTFLSM